MKATRSRTDLLQGVAAVAALASTLTLLLVPSAVAGPLTYSNPFADYGQVQNTVCGGAPKGICGAASAINSFVFLSNFYPTVYAGSKITTGPEVGANALSNAALDFAVNGWTGPNNVQYKGYYPRPGDLYTDYVATLADWLNSFAPNTTSISSMFPGNAGTGQNGNPSFGFLMDKMQSHSDLELFLLDSTNIQKGHVVTLISSSFAFDPVLGCTGDNCSITYQDPNDPTNTHTDIITAVSGTLGFSDPTLFGGDLVNMTGAFAEVPIPEPSSLSVLAGAVLALGALAPLSGRRKQTAASPWPARRGARGDALFLV